MDWWSNFVDWSGSDRGSQLIAGAVVPFVAIVVAGVVAALIGRGATKRIIAVQEREARNAAVAGIISAARKASTWGSLGHDERAYADHLAEDADIRLRLLPVSGAPVAANWAQHEIADIKRNSSTFSFQAEQSLSEFRDRMLEWQSRPSRARRLFRNDLERWKFETPDPDADLITRQQAWNAEQIDQPRSRAGRPAADPAAASGAVAAASGAGTLTGSPAAVVPEGARPAAVSQGSEGGRATPLPGAVAPAAVVPAPPGPAPASADGPSTSAPAAERRDEPGALTHPKVDAASPAGDTSTTSIPTRITDVPAEFADPHETDEAPYGAPVSASELRRRSEDDD
ncbi:hypothetical protein [Curtobacterium sp. RRHDQ10]|uniref:hypothetical protein n=1 Tax=Curtobacterium phyllosphaerae TaxID=3413379 RepID=UPI003BF1D3C7